MKDWSKQSILHNGEDWVPLKQVKVIEGFHTEYENRLEKTVEHLNDEVKELVGLLREGIKKAQSGNFNVAKLVWLEEIQRLVDRYHGTGLDDN